MINYDKMVQRIVEKWDLVYEDDFIDVRVNRDTGARAVFFIRDDGYFDLCVFNGLNVKRYRGYWVADMIEVERVE